MTWDIRLHRWFAFALCLLLAPGSALRAATVTGTIYAADGSLFTGTMLFRTLRTPLVSGSTLVTGGDYRVSVTNGALSTTLLAGDYRGFVGADQKGFILAVPSGSGSYSLLSLITNALTYTDQTYPWENAPLATTTVSGVVKTDVTEGDPVVYTKASVDALLATNSAPSKLDITNGTAVNLTLTGTTTFRGTNLATTIDAKLGAADIGTTVQAYDAELTSWAAIAPATKLDVSSGSATNLTVTKPFLIPFSSLRVFGDSTSDAASDWPGLLATDWGVTVNNQAVAGYYLYDMINRAFTNTVETNTAVALQCCVNNSKIETTAHYNAFSNALAAAIVYHAVPDSQKVFADNALVTYSGTWSSDSRWHGKGKVSTTQSSTVQWTNYGTVVYVATRQTNALGGSKFSITIDGTLQGTYAANGGSASAAGAMLLRFGGLSETAHTIVLTVTSATSVANPVWFDWGAGNLGNNTETGPYFYLSTTSRRTPAAYSAAGGSDTSVSTQNRIARALNNQFSADGLSTHLVELGALYDPNTSGDSVDGTHPSTTGARKMVNAFKAEMTANLFPRDRHSAPATTELLQPLDAALTALAAGSDFVTFSGPATSIKTFTLPDASTTLATLESTQTLVAKKLSESATVTPDDSFEGNQVTGRVNSGGVTQWDAVYINGSGQWVLADADGSGTYPALGLAVATASTGAATTVVTRGIVRNDSWAWAPGLPVYLSTTAGGLTQTAPTGISAVMQALGVAITSDVIYLNATGLSGPASARLALIDSANSWSDGVKQTFNPNGTSAGINIGSQSGDPSSLANGDMWYDSSGGNAFRARINGASVTMASKDDTMPETSTLSYSGTSVTLSAGGRKEYSHSLIVTNAFTLNISGATDGDRGIIYCWPAVTTNCAVTLTSPARAPSGGISVTASGSASAYTNYTALAWQVGKFQGTNIITVNGLNYQ